MRKREKGFIIGAGGGRELPQGGIEGDYDWFLKPIIFGAPQDIGKRLEDIGRGDYNDVLLYPLVYDFNILLLGTLWGVTPPINDLNVDSLR